jgi:hypothetical protein
MIGVVAAVTAAISMPALGYVIGLTTLPSDTDAVDPARYPAAALTLLWTELGGRNEPLLPRLGPYTLLAASMRGAPEPGRRLAVQAARALLDRRPEPGSILSWLSLPTATVWVSRHWGALQALAAIAEAADCGHGLYGLHEAARGYFGRPLGELSEAELATLVVASRSRRFDPWCRPGEVEPAVRSLIRLTGVEPTSATRSAVSLKEVPLHACLE